MSAMTGLRVNTQVGCGTSRGEARMLHERLLALLSDKEIVMLGEAFLAVIAALFLFVARKIANAAQQQATVLATQTTGAVTTTTAQLQKEIGEFRLEVQNHSSALTIMSKSVDRLERQLDHQQTLLQSTLAQNSRDIIRLQAQMESVMKELTRTLPSEPLVGG